MKILLTNDDGIFAAGLAAMQKRLSTLGDVFVAAPANVCSGAGHSISLKEIGCEYMDLVGKFQGYSVDGSPADCVKLAVNELFDIKGKFDLVVSGINHGANVGINVFYSGTVAGAIEAAFYDLPAIAVSAALDDPLDLETAADCALDVIRQLTDLPAGQVANLNIPQLSKGKPKGLMVVPQSTHGFDEQYKIREDQYGQQAYLLTGGNPRDPKNQDWTDTTALAAGYITLTSLRQDLTDLKGNDRLKQRPLKLTQ